MMIDIIIWCQQFSSIQLMFNNVSSHDPDDINNWNKKRMTVEQTEEEVRTG
jgi:hypothetical protein